MITRTSDGRIIPAETEYKVVKGDNLGKIARQFGVSVSDLRSWNKLKNDNLRIGQVLIVSGYAAGASKGAASAPKASSSGSKEKKQEAKKEEPKKEEAKEEKEDEVKEEGKEEVKEEAKEEKKEEAKPEKKQEPKKDEYITYKVKKGDTLYKIARDHGCSVDDLKSWNKLTSNNLSVGQKLKIRK